jgi:hypothetical protein
MHTNTHAECLIIHSHSYSFVLIEQKIIISYPFSIPRSLASLDRFILSLMLTAYMFVAWSPDRKDYEYQRNQLELKKLELRYDFKQ